MKDLKRPGGVRPLLFSAPDFFTLSRFLPPTGYTFSAKRSPAALLRVRIG
jgi:hypothetical protein